MQITKAMWKNMNELTHYFGHDINDETKVFAGLIIESVWLEHIELFWKFVNLKIAKEIHNLKATCTWN